MSDLSQMSREELQELAAKRVVEQQLQQIAERVVKGGKK